MATVLATDAALSRFLLSLRNLQHFNHFPDFTKLVGEASSMKWWARFRLR